jgi:hypothetical protein
MSTGASERRDDRSSLQLSKGTLRELGRFNLSAVYSTLADAQASAADVRAAGVPPRRILLQDRRLTDEVRPVRRVGPVSRTAPPTGEPVQTPTRRRDAEVAHGVFARMVIWLAGATLAGAVLGFLIGLAIFGLAAETLITVAAVAVAGSVFGAMGGGIRGAMNQARDEEGFLVEVHTDDPGEAQRIGEALARRGPIRLDRMAIDQGPGTA